MSFDNDTDVAGDTSITTISNFNFAESLMLASRVPAVVKTPKDARDEQLLSEVDELSERFISSHSATKNRGNAELYQCIADATLLLGKIESDTRRDAVLEQLRARLRTRGIKVQTNSSPEIILIKTLLNSTRSSASQYAAVVRHALNNSIKPTELAERLASDGGIRKFVAAAENTAARKLHVRMCTIVMRAQMLMSHSTNSPVIDWKDVVYEAGDLVAVKTFVAVMDDKGAYRVVLAATPSEAYIDDLIKTIVNESGINVPQSAAALLKRRAELGLVGFDNGLSQDELRKVTAVATLDPADYQNWLVMSSKPNPSAKSVAKQI